MSQYMTSDDLIVSVKRRISAPTAQNLFSDEDILAFAYEELSLGLLPKVIELHEDHLLYTVTIPLVDNQPRYEIPYRAIGSKLNDMSFNSNNSTYAMTRIEKADLPNYKNSNNFGLVANTFTPFYIEGNEVVLLTDNVKASQGALDMSFYIRPNSLVLLENVGVITGIDRMTGVINLSSTPSGFSANQLMDFIQVKTPHKTISFDIQPVSVDSTSNTVTFNVDDIPSQLAVGDHIAKATECAIPQIPSDLHVMLAHRTGMAMMEAMGDLEMLGRADKKLAEFEDRTSVLIGSRVEGSPRKIVNRYGLIRGGLNSRLNRIRR